MAKEQDKHKVWIKGKKKEGKKSEKVLMGEAR